MDVDICGPSIPTILGIASEQVHSSSSGWSPVYVQDNLGVMSVGFMLPSSKDAVMWRGPKKNAMIKQFLGDVRWGELDYLIVDTPPGELSMPASARGKTGRGGAECNERRAGGKERSDVWAGQRAYAFKRDRWRRLCVVQSRETHGLRALGLTLHLHSDTNP